MLLNAWNVLLVTTLLCLQEQIINVLLVVLYIQAVRHVCYIMDSPLVLNVLQDTSSKVEAVLPDVKQ